MQILFLESMNLQLSKTVPGIMLRPLDHFLHIFELWSIFAKMMIFAILGSRKIFSWDSKNRSRSHSDIPRTVLESLRSIFYTPPQLKSEIWPPLQPERYTCIFRPKVRHFLDYTVLVPKMGENCNFVDANFIFEKYGPSAFQNRSGNVATTSSCDFMQI